MASAAKVEWDTTGQRRLDELERVHADAFGTGPETRWGAHQLKQSLFVVLVAQFQTYCRNLHDEATDVHVSQANVHQADLIRRLLTQGRKLDVHSPRPGSLGSDFARLGFELIPTLKVQDARASDALARLDLLVRFRNAVVHGNESELASTVASGEIAATLTWYRRYRGTLNQLVGTMDRVVAAELALGLQITPPW